MILRIHVLLVDRVQPNHPKYIFGEGNSIRQRQTSRPRIDLANVQDDEATSEKRYEGPDNVHSQGEPSICRPQVEKRAMMRVDPVKVFPNETSLIAVRTNRSDPAERLSKVLIQGTALDGFQTLENPRGPDVESSDKDIEGADENSGDEKTGRDDRNENHNRDDRGETADHAHGNGSDLLINGFNVLGEAVHQLSQRR